MSEQPPLGLRQGPLIVGDESEPSSDSVEQASVTSSPSTRDRGGVELDLHEELVDCECWSDVLDIVHDERLSLTTRNLVTALKKLASLCRGMSRPEIQSQMQTEHYGVLQLLIQKHCPTMSAFQVVNAMYSMAVMGHADTKTLALCSMRVEAVLKDFNDRDVSSVLYAYASLKRSPSKELLEKLTVKAQQLVDLGLVAPQGISMILWSCATLGFCNHFLVTAITTAIEGRFPEGYTSQGVANIIWSLARLQRFSPVLVKAALSHFQAKAESYRPQECFNLLWAVARFRYHPQGAFANFLSCASRHASSLQPADIGNIFQALATFSQIVDPRDMGLLLSRTEQLLARFTPAEVCSLYWALGLLDETHQPVFSKLSDLIIGLHQNGSLTESLQRQVLQGFLSAKMAQAEVELPTDLLDSCKKAWISQCQDSPPSSLTRAVSDVLKELRVHHVVRQHAVGGLVSIDIALKPSPTRFVALQITGEHEQACNTGQLLGPLQFQRKLLEENGWEVKLLTAREYGAIPEDKRVLYLAEYMKSLGVSVRDETLRRAASLPDAGPGRSSRRAQMLRGVTGSGAGEAAWDLPRRSSSSWDREGPSEREADLLMRSREGERVRDRRREGGRRR